MAVGGRVRADPRVNQRVRHYRMVVGTESDVEANGLLLYCGLAYRTFLSSANRVPHNKPKL